MQLLDQALRQQSAHQRGAIRDEDSAAGILLEVGDGGGHMAGERSGGPAELVQRGRGDVLGGIAFIWSANSPSRSRHGCVRGDAGCAWWLL